MIRTVLTWLAIAIVALWVIHNPDGAAADASQFVHALTTLASHL